MPKGLSPKGTTWILAAVALVLPVGSALAQDASGVWNTEDNAGKVRVAPCGTALCGTLIGLSEPNDDQGKPKTDYHNVDASKRGRPMIGVPILLSMKAEDGNRWRGEVYNAEDGKTYAATFTLDSPSRAVLEGCVMRVFCKKQVWTKAR